MGEPVSMNDKYMKQFMDFDQSTGSGSRWLGGRPQAVQLVCSVQCTGVVEWHSGKEVGDYQLVLQLHCRISRRH
ncbi:hypothetical protein Pcinc_011582 [Petrolisthes cinctipes]|uniref:Uncharacterized protein n=1 Tax=Petrolisthes cinctipes TaxID=88211 RepID=A0AAE1G2F4_PETCI|nr:hypothetical protein Pcinc_011582 [Petrolisthes cinctipes]